MTDELPPKPDELRPEPQPPPPPPASRRMQVLGIHHVTLICSDLERTAGFYRDVLGLALLREATNDDDPGARHHWFSTTLGGEAGTLLSFLEYPQMQAGTQGTGATHHLALAVASADEVEAWRDYLRSRNVPTTEALDRGGLRSLYIRDPDGHIIEIVAAAA